MFHRPINTYHLEQQITDAFIDLDFRVTEQRKKCFYELCFQYYKIEGRRIMDEAVRSRPTPYSALDIPDSCAIRFLAKYACQLWPSDETECGHLTKRYLEENVFFTYEASRNSFHDLYGDGVRFSFRARIKQYFELLDQVPVRLQPDLSASSLEAVDLLVQRIIDTSNDAQSAITCTPSTPSFSSSLSVPAASVVPPAAPSTEVVRRTLPQLETNTMLTQPSSSTTPSIWNTHTWQVGSHPSPGYASNPNCTPASPGYVSPYSSPWYLPKPSMPYTPTGPRARNQTGNVTPTYTPLSPFAPQTPATPGQRTSTSSPQIQTSSPAAVSPTAPYTTPRSSFGTSPSARQSPTSPYMYYARQRATPSTSRPSSPRFPDSGPPFGSQGKPS